MKTFTKNFKKQENTISDLLKQNRADYTPETFHKLRVEIKKLDASFELINFCSKDFKRKKTFKTFKLIFRQAGRVRELQVEEAILKKYFRSNFLKNYRNNLKQRLLKEKADYFLIVNNKPASRLKKTIQKVKPLIAQIDKKKPESYMKRKRKTIEKTIRKKTLKASQLHLLRKHLKGFHFNRKSLGLKKVNDPLQKKDFLPRLLGKWHDCQVVIRHLKKAISTAGMHPQELGQLQKVEAKISAERNVLYDKISNVIVHWNFADHIM